MIIHLESSILTVQFFSILDHIYIVMVNYSFKRFDYLPVTCFDPSWFVIQVIHT